jgi:hypothetical protein
MRIVYLICETAAGGQCTESVLAFEPAIPVACIHAAGPELARITPDGWHISRWRCHGDDTDHTYARNDRDD